MTDERRLPNKVDIAIAGGGLSGSLLAWRMKERHPDLSIALIEKGDRLGGNHTWSFHETDVSPQILDWLQPMIAYRWPGQEVRFPAYRRRLETAYCTVPSQNLVSYLQPKIGQSVHTGLAVKALSSDCVTLEDGRHLSAGAVIDARGQGDYDDLIIGFQKFHGVEYRFQQPHGLTAPIIMDATVDQIDGYRFVYVLPFTEDTALVEDTYYADGPSLDIQAIRSRIDEYCAQQGWEPAEVLKTEDGILPIAMGGNMPAHLAKTPEGVALIGLRAGLFHPLTGYSLADAATTAEAISQLDDPVSYDLSVVTRDAAAASWGDRGFYRLLSRLLFDAADPDRRYHVMQRFYSLNGGLIERLYAARSTRADKMRILAGKPPVNFFRALKCVNEERWQRKYRSKTAA